MEKIARRGRPDRLTAAVQERIIQALRAGAYAEEAAASAGVSRRTYHRWRARGEADHAPASFRDFAAAVRQAEADAELYALAVIHKAMPDDWRAAMTYLERRYPQRWARRTKIEREGGVPVQTQISGEVDLGPATRELVSRALGEVRKAAE